MFKIDLNKFNFMIRLVRINTFYENFRFHTCKKLTYNMGKIHLAKKYKCLKLKSHNIY